MEVKLSQDDRNELDNRLIANSFSGYEGLSDWLESKGYKISKSSVHRYGSKLEEKFAAIAASTQAAKTLVAAAPDDDGSVNELVLRMVQDELLKLLANSDEGFAAKDLSAIARAVADITRGSISSKKYRSEVKEKIAAKFKELETQSSKKGLDAETLRIIREEVYGVVS